jgi:predicted RNA binding protein YcfA (HicA-like mRNA interferase family)
LKGYGKAVRKTLTEAGCRFLRQGRGDHEVWTSPHARKPFTVPVTILSRHTANKVLKDAGLRKEF